MEEKNTTLLLVLSPRPRLLGFWKIAICNSHLVLFTLKAFSNTSHDYYVRFHIFRNRRDTKGAYQKFAKRL